MDNTLIEGNKQFSCFKIYTSSISNKVKEEDKERDKQEERNNIENFQRDAGLSIITPKSV